MSKDGAELLTLVVFMFMKNISQEKKYSVILFHLHKINLANKKKARIMENLKLSKYTIPFDICIWRAIFVYTLAQSSER